MQIMDSQRPN